MKLASIEFIKDIRPHKNADRLEIATVLGWQTIVKKGEFRTGDRCVFVVIDTILPDAPWSAFLKDGDKPIRLRSIKLRGEYSQGLVLPITVLRESTQGWQVGADVGGELQIRKYEKEIPAQLSGEALGAFPSYVVSKADEDNGLSNPELVEEVLRHPVCVTMKLDGSSMTVIVNNGEIAHVCSRRLSLKESDKNAFWIAARKLKFPDNFSGVIQGELMGPGIQGNQLKLMSPEIYVYQVRMGHAWTDPVIMSLFCSKSIKAKRVPVVIEHKQDTTLPFLQSIADNLTLPDGSPAEGIVVRPFHMPASGIGRPLGFKIINRNYKD